MLILAGQYFSHCSNRASSLFPYWGAACHNFPRVTICTRHLKKKSRLLICNRISLRCSLHIQTPCPPSLLLHSPNCIIIWYSAFTFRRNWGSSGTNTSTQGHTLTDASIRNRRGRMRHLQQALLLEGSASLVLPGQCIPRVWKCRVHLEELQLNVSNLHISIENQKYWENPAMELSGIPVSHLMCCWVIFYLKATLFHRPLPKWSLFVTIGREICSKKLSKEKVILFVFPFFILKG